MAMLWHDKAKVPRWFECIISLVITHGEHQAYAIEADYMLEHGIFDGGGDAGGDKAEGGGELGGN